MASSITGASRLNQFLRLEERYHSLQSLKIKIEDSSLDNKIHQICLNALKVASEMTIDELSKVHKTFLYALWSHAASDPKDNQALQNISKCIPQLNKFLQLPIEGFLEVISFIPTASLRSLLQLALDNKYFAYKKNKSSQVVYYQKIIRAICSEIVGRSDHQFTKLELIKLIKLACYIEDGVLKTDIQQLSIWNTRFTLEEFHLLLSVCPLLKELHLDACFGFSDEHFSKLKENSRLQTLKFTKSIYTSILTDHFIDYLPEGLEVFECEFTCYFTDAIAKKLPCFLQTLSLFDSPQLTDVFFNDLPKSVTNVDVNFRSPKSIGSLKALSSRISELRLIGIETPDVLKELERFELKKLYLRYPFKTSFPNLSLLQNLTLDTLLTDSLIEALPAQLTNLRLEYSRPFKASYLEKLPTSLTALGFEHRKDEYSDTPALQDRDLQALSRYPQLRKLKLGRSYLIGGMKTDLTESCMNFLPKTLQFLQVVNFSAQITRNNSLSSLNLTTLKIVSFIEEKFLEEIFNSLPKSLLNLSWRSENFGMIEKRTVNAKAFERLPPHLTNLRLCSWMLYDEEIASLPNSIRRLDLWRNSKDLTIKALESLPEQIEEFEFPWSISKELKKKIRVLLAKQGINSFVNFKTDDFMKREAGNSYRFQGRQIAFFRLDITD